MTCNGLANWPTAERINLGSLPKSRVGSIPFRARHSQGWMWRMLELPSGSGALYTKRPNRPFSASLLAERPKWRQPHGQAVNWLPQACNAHGATPLALRRYLEKSPSAPPKAHFSMSDNLRANSSSWSHGKILGMTCSNMERACEQVNSGIWISPIKDEVMIQYDLLRLHGQTWSNFRLRCTQWEFVTWQKCSISLLTNWSWDAGAAHSKIKTWTLRQKAAKRIFVRLLARGSEDPLPSPSAENGWQLKPPVIAREPCDNFQICWMTCLSPTSPVIVGTLETLENKSTIFALQSTATEVWNPLGRIPCEKPPNPLQTSMTDWILSQVTSRWPKMQLDGVKLIKGTGNCASKTASKIV